MAKRWPPALSLVVSDEASQKEGTSTGAFHIYSGNALLQVLNLCLICLKFRHHLKLEVDLTKELKCRN